MRKVLKMLLVFAIMFTQVLPAIVVNAAETGSITISNAVEGEDYSIYKILDLETYIKGEGEGSGKFIYRIAAGWEAFVKTGDGKDYLEVKSGTYSGEYVVWKAGTTDADKKAFTELALQYAKNNEIAATKTLTANGTTVEFTNLELGYYLVDSSLGALCSLTTTVPNATVKEKNSIPSLEKLVKEGTEFGKKNDAKIGDIVEFESTITVGKGTENYVLHDKMSEGFTFNADSVTVYIRTLDAETNENIDTLVDAKNYNLTTENNDQCTFEIEFLNSYIKSLDKDTEIVVKYSAVLNEKAEIKGEGNLNETYLTYGNNQESTHDKTTTYTYDFELIKVNSSNEILEGAEFLLYDAEKDGNLIEVVLIDAENNIYRVATENEEGTTIKVGSATIVGLDNKKYYLEETVAPEGYNILTSRVPVEVKGTSLTTQTVTFEKTEVSVLNLTGSQLPETGGMGTKLFVTTGLTMIIIFGVMLVTKLRMSKIMD